MAQGPLALLMNGLTQQPYLLSMLAKNEVVIVQGYVTLANRLLVLPVEKINGFIRNA
jgi:hypothetical protein